MSFFFKISNSSVDHAIDSIIRGEYFTKDRLKSEINQYLDSVEFYNKVSERKGRYSSI